MGKFPIVLGFILTVVVSLTTARSNELNKIDLGLLKTLKEQNMANIFVSFVQGTSSILQAITDTRFPTRDDRLIALKSALKLNAQESQYNVKEFLDQSNVLYEVIWITNQLYVPNATIQIMDTLILYQEVKEIREEQFALVEEPILAGPIVKRESTMAEWGIKKIQAEEAQALLRNVTTNFLNIRIATIDTGVRVTHEALRDNFLGQYGWFDPYEKTEMPNDYNGHGTHATGTICGKGGIGVFPDAKWAACKGCSTFSCSQIALLSCAQFITCPTLSDGLGEDCTKAPHLVSNSWGSAGGNTFFDDVIAAWHAAQIIPLFSIGNSGPTCSSVGSPGDRNVIGVGATTEDDGISAFSGVGPARDGRIKPEVSAPGANVLSAYNTADDEYRELSGTSMACPHTSGLTALLLAFKEDLTYNEVIQYLFKGVETEPLQSSGAECNGIPDTQFPNYFFGQGRINAFQSLKTLIDFYSKH